MSRRKKKPRRVWATPQSSCLPSTRRWKLESESKPFEPDTHLPIAFKLELYTCATNKHQFSIQFPLLGNILHLSNQKASIWTHRTSLSLLKRHRRSRANHHHQDQHPKPKNAPATPKPAICAAVKKLDACPVKMIPRTVRTASKKAAIVTTSRTTDEG
jgi:hypothetical protein